MTRTRAILLVCFLLTFAAGAAVGWRVTGSSHSSKRHSWLSNEMKLSAEQREQMKKIWSDARTATKSQEEQHAAAAQQRDQAVTGLLSPEQRKAYDAIQHTYAAKMQELDTPLTQAIERTRAILTPEQAQKFDELMKKPHGRRLGFHGPREATSSSMPTTQKQPTSRVGE
jgi:Spy/CpxP family protein refolding chaperone